MCSGSVKYVVEQMTVETRWFRSDTHTVNTYTVKNLGTSKSGTADQEYVDWQSASQQDVYMRILVQKVAEDGTLTDIAAGAVVTVSPNTNGLVSATIDIPETELETTDAILVEVQYSTDGSTWTSLSSELQGADWITEQLGTTILNAATWTVYYAYSYESTYSPFTHRYDNTLYFDYDGDYDSRIENFTYGEVVSAVKRIFGDGITWIINLRR